ncbi:MAG TPA: NDP-sugar synthase [Blastocatellia bacterium]|nr:NDP-sugar synthase [Blastocatellia bacterium]
MKGFILAAGFGTRLWPLTEDRTKPAIPFLNKPLITYSVSYLASHAIRDIIVNLHHQPDSIRNALGTGRAFGVSICYSFEEEILGTSGALDFVREALVEDDFVVINGKIVTDIDLSKAIQAHRERGAIATLVLRENPALERFSIVETAADGRVTRFAGMPDPAQSGDSAPLMFTGIQILSPRIFRYIPRSRFSHSTVDVYPQAIAAGEVVLGHVAAGSWYEMSTLSRYFEASLRFMRGRDESVTQGAGCVIGDGALVQNSVLWDRVTVEPNSTVRLAVLADDVRIPAGQYIEHSVVVLRDRVREIERGELIGENLVVPFRARFGEHID